LRFVGSPIRQPLSDDATDALVHTLCVAHFARVPIEILLGRITMQMRFGQMMEPSEDGAL
jgi:hypothetical protein